MFGVERSLGAVGGFENQLHTPLSNSLTSQLLIDIARLLFPEGSGSETVLAHSADRTPGAQRADAVPYFPDNFRVEATQEEQSPQTIGVLADVHPPLITSFEQAVQRVLQQLQSLEQQFGNLIAGIGIYHWLASIALGAAACALWLRQRRRHAVSAVALRDEEAALLGAPEFSFLIQEHA